MYKKACVYGGVCRIAGYSSVPLFRRCVRGLGKGTRIVHFLHRTLCLWGLKVHWDCAWKVHWRVSRGVRPILQNKRYKRVCFGEA